MSLATRPGTSERFFSGKPKFADATQCGADGFAVLRGAVPDFGDLGEKVGKAVVAELELRLPNSPGIKDFGGLHPQNMPTGYKILSTYR